MWHLIFSNMWQRPTRTLVSVMAVSLGVVLLLVTVGLSYGQLNDQAARARQVGGDFILQPSGASLFLALNSGTLPVKVASVVESIEGVKGATPVLVKFISQGFHSLFGIEKSSFDSVSGGLSFVSGRMFEQPYEAVVDTIHAGSNNLKSGDRVKLLGHEFEISGIFQEGTAGRVLVPLETLQELNGTPDKATVIFVSAHEDESKEAVESRLEEVFANYKITRTADFQNLLVNTAPAFKQFLSAIIFLSVTISFVITLLAMYSNIIERTREIGILKSLGASRLYIIQLILRESLLISILGVIAGFLMTWITIEVLSSRFPTLPFSISYTWRLLAVLMAVGGATLGALYPAIKAARLDPVRALGYE